MPFISILVMSHNQEAFIGPCLDSVFAQRYNGPAEIIVCDDASTDATFEHIRQKAQEYKGTFPLVIHHCEENHGVAENMNVAVSLSHGDWLMRVDGDDILHPDRLRLSALAIMKHPGIAAVSGQLEEFTDKPAEKRNPPDDALAFSIWNHGSFDAQGKMLQPGLAWWGGVMTFSRQIFSVFGNMPRGCDVLDDTMFATRVLMLGDFVIITNATLLYYRRHGGNISSSRTAGRRGPLQLMRDDLASRMYYRRGIPCHAPILEEMERHAGGKPQLQGLLQHFRQHLASLRDSALFWEKPWKERIAQGGARGSLSPFWIFRTSCPLAYAIAAWLKQR